MLRSHRLPASICPALSLRVRLAIAAGLLLALSALSVAGARALASGDAAGGAPDSMAVTVELEPGAVLSIAGVLEAPADAAARTWPIEIVGASGSAVERIQLPLSGDAPRADVRRR
ncbi:MAG: hypothetical protein U5Q44_13390 [Dehalococcoidia bacterium]|nr:hypothetical protein [Dehalococcoidia bacterium]